jgi:hypothetical protein
MTDGAPLAVKPRYQALLWEGLKGAAEFEREHGGITERELADAKAWAEDIILRSRRADTHEGDIGSGRGCPDDGPR